MTIVVALLLSQYVDQCGLYVSQVDLVWRQYREQLVKTNEARKAFASCKANCEGAELSVELAEANLDWHARQLTKDIEEAKKNCPKP